MERTVGSLIGLRIEATDGDAGKVEDVFFDDESWNVRYLVLKTNDWISGSKVLIAPVALQADCGLTGIFRVNLTLDQIRHSPGIDTDKPVSRQQEIELYGHYDWKGYWDSGFYAEGYESVVAGLPKEGKWLGADLHLRSTRYVSGFHVHGTDGELGYIYDFIIDDRSWEAPNLIVCTSALPEGKKVLVGVEHIMYMRWSDAEVYLSESKAEIEENAVFEPSAFSGASGI